ncbi:hypothetical protein N644_2155 [Lactiplantibacillus paraplantarum]|nr:hypothetical protein N644_2155 [Lactiplantibacillus paraplantarum]
MRSIVSTRNTVSNKHINKRRSGFGWDVFFCGNGAAKN